MRTRTILLVLFACTLAFAQARPSRPRPQPQSDAAQTLRKLEQDWLTALSKRDAAAVDALLAPDFRDIGVDGLAHTRTQVLALVTDPTRPALQHSIGRLDIRAYGLQFAVSTGLELVSGENLREAHIAFTHVWVHRDGKWQAVSSQETLSSE
jgi:hypothetical protein